MPPPPLEGESSLPPLHGIEIMVDADLFFASAVLPVSVHLSKLLQLALYGAFAALTLKRSDHDQSWCPR